MDAQRLATEIERKKRATRMEFGRFQAKNTKYNAVTLKEIFDDFTEKVEVFLPTGSSTEQTDVEMLAKTLKLMAFLSMYIDDVIGW